MGVNRATRLADQLLDKIEIILYLSFGYLSYSFRALLGIFCSIPVTLIAPNEVSAAIPGDAVAGYK